MYLGTICTNNTMRKTWISLIRC